MTNEEAAALIAAGRLLQSKGWISGRKRIERTSGEKYPEAVLRTINSLPETEREMLRELVAWVRDYERAEQSAALSRTRESKS